MKAFITISIATLFMSLNSQAATDNLEPFINYNGLYTISSDAGPYCQSAYKNLFLAVDAQMQTVGEFFDGEGKLNGLPAAGEFNIPVSLKNTTDLPSLNGRRSERIVIDDQTIVTQESVYAPIYGLFGKWKNTGKILKFEKSGDVTVYRSGFGCLFNKK